MKLISPVHPQLATSAGGDRCSADGTVTPPVPAKLREAMVLYRQEQRRWLECSAEACLTAYLVSPALCVCVCAVIAQINFIYFSLIGDNRDWPFAAFRIRFYI